VTELGESVLTRQPAGEWLTPGRFALILGLLIFASFPQVLLGFQTFVVRDFGFFVYPLAQYQRDCFWHGELPFWNPYNNCGVPFLAQWNTMPLYPPALIYLLLPLGWSLNFFCLLHLFLAGMGMYVLAHRWTGSRLGASVAGLVFAFNGLSLNLLMWPSHMATLGWMPWVIWSVEQGWQRGGRKLVLAALLGALQMLAGGPETILMTWLLLAGLWVTELISERRAPALRRAKSALGEQPQRAELELCAPFWRVFCRFPIMVILVAGLAAAQLLPFLDLAAHSQREAGYADTRWSMPGWGWANFLVPRVFGYVWSMGVFFQYGQSWTSSYYVGTGALLLAILAVWTVRTRRVTLLAIAAGLAFTLALGDRTFVYRWLRDLLPQLSLITYPVKFVTIIAFAAPLLAAFALGRLQLSTQKQESRLNKRILVIAGVLLGLITAILIWAWLCPFPTDDFPATLINGLTRAVLLAVAVFLLFLTGQSTPWNTAQPADASPSSSPSHAHVCISEQKCSYLSEEADTAGAITGASSPRPSPPEEEREEGGAQLTPSAAQPSRQRSLFRLLGSTSSRGVLNPGLLVPVLLLAVFWLDVWTHEPNQNPTVPPSVYEPGMVRAKLEGENQPQPVLGKSRAMVSPEAEQKFTGFIVSDPANNFLAKRLGYFSDCNVLDAVPKVNGFFSLYPRECGEVTSVLYGSTNTSFPGLMDFMGVSQVTAPGEFFTWTNRASFLPLITAGQQPLFRDDTNSLYGLIRRDFDGRKVVFLPLENRTFVSVTNASSAKVLSSQFSPSRVEFEIEADAPALAVISQTYFHWWQANVDGRPVPLLRANYAFQAVEVPSGRHTVELAYRDRSFVAGVILSLLSLAVCLCAWLLNRVPSKPGQLASGAQNE
jgi:hypothetical protein